MHRKGFLNVSNMQYLNQPFLNVPGCLLAGILQIINLSGGGSFTFFIAASIIYRQHLSSTQLESLD